MFLFRLSRLQDEKALDNIMAVTDGCKFYVDKVNFPVCAAYPAKNGGGMLAIYPFSKYPVSF